MTLATARVDASDALHQDFVDRLQPLVPLALRLAHAMLRNPAEAEDAVQDAILNAWRAFGRLRPDSEVRPWFLTVVANECRQRRRNRWWSVLKGAELPEVASPDPAAASDQADELRCALDLLSHRQRLAVVLRYYLDCSYEEVGRTLGVSGPAAKSCVHRALSRLRTEFPEVGDNA